ncbi:MAG: hypothetical protein DI535_27370 [Citrobacter freundii]|nr:MAG: hypothetical protein DI535_27370 [Citrobacter freundii]
MKNINNCMRTILQRICAAVLTMICGMQTHAQLQRLPVAEVSYEPSRLKNDTTNGALKNISVFVNLPVMNREKVKMGGRIGYQHVQITDLGAALDHSLTALEGNLFRLRKLDERHQLHFTIQAGIYSDFKDLQTDDLRYRLSFSYLVKHSESFSTGWGMAYARQFFGHQINPFILINYQINEKLKLSGLFPIRPVLTYQLSKRFSWVNELTGTVQSFRLSDNGNDQRNGFIQLSGWKILSSGKMLVGKRHLFSAGIGFALRQNTSYYEDDGSRNWKLFTFDLSEKNPPVRSVNTKGVSFMIGYDLIL